MPDLKLRGEFAPATEQHDRFVFPRPRRRPDAPSRRPVRDPDVLVNLAPYWAHPPARSENAMEALSTAIDATFEKMQADLNMLRDDVESFRFPGGAGPKPAA